MNREQFYALFGKSAEMGAKGAQEQQAHQAALAQLIKGKQMDLSNSKDEAQFKTDEDLRKDKTLGDANLQTAKDTLADYSGKGKKANVSIGAGGTVALSENEPDMMSKLSGKDIDAKKHAMDFYNHQLPDLQKQAGHMTTALGVVSDPKNTMSLGAAKAAALQAYGLNRFNEAESNNTIGPSAQGMLAKMGNWAGDDNSPLTDAQRKDVMALMTESLKGVQAKHNQVKQQALMTYNQLSPQANPAASQMLEQGFGANGFEKGIGDSLSKYAPAPAQNAPGAGPAQAQAAPQPQAPKQSALSALFGGPKPQAQAAPQQQSPQAPLGFEEFKARRAAGQL